MIVANSKVEEYEALKELLEETTVTANKILEDYKAYIDGEIVKGTMLNNGGVTKTINAGESYTIPQGYHNGTGVITASTLEGQTSGTVTADKILKGYTAYKDGKLIKGTMENYAGKTVSVSTITESGENALITIPEEGYYSTSSKISIPVSEINSNLDNDFVIGTCTGTDEITIGDKWNILVVWTTINSKAAFEVCMKDKDGNLTHISGQYNMYAGYTGQWQFVFNDNNSGFTLKNWPSNTWNYAYK